MSIILSQQSPLANLSSTNINNNILIIDGELSELMCNTICEDLSHSPQITGMYFAAPLSPHTLQTILNQVALINCITDVYFSQDYTVEMLSLAMSALNSSHSKKTIWANISDIGRKKISVHGKNPLVTINEMNEALLKVI